MMAMLLMMMSICASFLWIQVLARAINQPINCAHSATLVCSTVMSASLFFCICHGFRLSVWASKMVVKPSVRQMCGCGWPGGPRAGGGLPDEGLECVVASEAFLLRGGQLECLICHMVDKGIGWLDFVVHFSVTLGLAQPIISPWLEPGHTNAADFARTCLARAYPPLSRPLHIRRLRGRAISYVGAPPARIWNRWSAHI